DVLEGGLDTDTVVVNCSNVADTISVTPNGTRVRLDRTNATAFTLDIGTAENLNVFLNGGNDNFSASGLGAGLITINADGGDGNDTMVGSGGNDFLFGGAGDDFVDGR